MSLKSSFAWVSQSSAPGQLFTFLFFTVISLILTILLGLAIAFPFWGVDIISFMSMEQLTNSDYVSFLKYFQIISQIGMFILPPLLFAYLSGPNVKSYLGLGKRPAYFALSMGILISIFCLPLINGFAELNQLIRLPGFLHDFEVWMKESENNAEILTKTFLSTTSFGGLLVNILMIAIIPAIGEEFFFRGILQKVFHEWLKNIHIAILVSAVLFSALHMQFYGFLPRMLLGILLGYFYAWTANLWIPILAHFLNNFLAVMAAFFFQQGISSSNYDSLGEAPGLWAYFLSGALTTILLIMMYKLTHPIHETQKAQDSHDRQDSHD